MTYSYISLEINSKVARITLMREDKRNALSPELISELTDVFLSLNANPEVLIIILTGGEKVFCAGADLKYLQSLSRNTVSDNISDSERIGKMFSAIYNSSKITIAAVNGFALAGGCGVASCCDFVVANRTTAQFGYTEVKIGFLAAIVAKYLVNRAGLQKASTLLLTGEILNAEKALSAGLIDYLSDNPAQSSMELAEQLLKNSAASLLQTKQLLRDVANLSASEASHLAVLRNVISRSTEDFKNGINSFLNKK